MSPNHPNYQALKRRASQLKVALFALLGMTIVSSLSDVFGMMALSRAIEGSFVSDAAMMEAMEALDARAGLVGLGFLGVYVASVICSARWIMKAHANLRELSVDPPETTPGWAVGWFFVPVANLVKPLQAMRELWWASLAPGAWREQGSSPGLLQGWWALWILANVLGNLASRMIMSADDMPALLSAYQFNLVAALALIPLTLVYWRIIQTITQMQAVQYQAMAGQPEQDSPW